MQNCHVFFLLWSGANRGRAAGLSGQAALWRPSGSGEVRKRKRRSRGSREDAHLRRRTMGGVGFRRGAELSDGRLGFATGGGALALLRR
jgi:hypothetical protein